MAYLGRIVAHDEQNDQSVNVDEGINWNFRQKSGREGTRPTPFTSNWQEPSTRLRFTVQGNTRQDIRGLLRVRRPSFLSARI